MLLNSVTKGLGPTRLDAIISRNRDQGTPFRRKGAVSTRRWPATNQGEMRLLRGGDRSERRWRRKGVGRTAVSAARRRPCRPVIAGRHGGVRVFWGIPPRSTRAGPTSDRPLSWRYGTARQGRAVVGEYGGAVEGTLGRGGRMAAAQPGRAGGRVSMGRWSLLEL